MYHRRNFSFVWGFQTDNFRGFSPYVDLLHVSPDGLIPILSLLVCLKIQTYGANIKNVETGCGNTGISVRVRYEIWDG